MSLQEQTLKAAALACWENAKAFSVEAKLLAEHGHGARAVALSILGLEEFAKAIGYVVAALSREPQEVLLSKLRCLNYHEVKHLALQSAEYAQIVTQDWADGIDWQTGYKPSAEQRLAVQLGRLAQEGLSGLLEEPQKAKSFFKDNEVLLAPDKKNAALYVDLAQDGQLKTPSRVAGDAASEILGLDWFMEQYIDLPFVLKDDAAWTRFTAGIRSLAESKKEI